ncbi:uncharacterized protein PSANT_05188 [Moesziomyces antarcticus]|uniref:Uncharacterized protein n=1 Tax=Pseudozyma antarctica TaxID=84753 RepID=A0A5C3FTK4_PSEA2|nr:uncharacterized protein PSANT_05188 [Moesziomyces antarcticus]
MVDFSRELPPLPYPVVAKNRLNPLEPTQAAAQSESDTSNAPVAAAREARERKELVTLIDCQHKTFVEVAIRTVIGQHWSKAYQSWLSGSKQAGASVSSQWDEL